MPARVADMALQHRKIAQARRCHVARARQHDGHVKPVGQAPARLDGGLVAAIDQHHARALQRDERDRRHLHLRGGDQGGGFGASGGGVLRPAACLADVDEGERGGRARVLGHLGEESSLLRAGDSDGRTVGQRGAKQGELRPAELVGALKRAAALGEGRLVERHGPLAGTDKKLGSSAAHAWKLQSG